VVSLDSIRVAPFRKIIQQKNKKGGGIDFQSKKKVKPINDTMAEIRLSVFQNYLTYETKQFERGKNQV
jgi:hypothetical protein